MANVSSIKLPNNTTYNIVDKTSGYTKNTGTITKIQTTAGAHTTIDVSSGAAAFNVPTKTSHLTNDSGFLTSHQDISGKVNKAGDTMTGNLVVPALRAANTYYGITYGRTTTTPVETILYTGIKWDSGAHMPVVHITGYAYGLQSPVEFKIGFYIYANAIGYCGVTNMGSWEPTVYLFKHTVDNQSYVAVGLAGSCYFLQLQADLQDEMGKFTHVDLDSSLWSWSFLTTAGTIPTPDSGVTCIQVPYKANILNPAKVNSHTVNADVPSGAKFTDTVTTATTTGSGNAVTAITASNGALTVTKGTTFLTSHQDISGKADKATTLAGYGITDAKIASGVITLGSNTITPLTSSSTLNAAKLSGAIPSAVTATTQSAGDNSTKIATTAFVSSAIANLPIPTSTGSATTGITIAAHGTGTVIGVQSSTTTASKVTVGSHSTDYGVKSAGSASTWTFEEKTIPNVTAAGSGSASLTFAMDTTDTKKLKITFSHTHTAPTIGTAIKVQSKSGGANSTAPTLGSKVPTVSASDVTVPIKNASASTFVTGTTHTVTDNGHTHTI